MSSNEQQIEYWNGEVGERWARLQETLDADMVDITASLLPFAAAKLGEHILDIGCGCGTTTIALAKAAGANGAVTGVDISRPMLSLARSRADAAKAKISFLEADAAAHAFAPEYDLAFSKFGVMFFADPLAAFSNIRKSLKPHGRLAFACWRTAAENLWASAPYAAARDLLPPQEPADPIAPGPFAFADSGRLRNILDEAGFTDIRIKPLDSVMHMGATIDDAAAQVLNIGPLAKAAADLDGRTREEIRRVAAQAMEKFKTPNGIAPLAACWLVGAVN
ncbi:MAG TPA: methyltransferase domain-containing protein [Rhizomicrobium sp.]|jgi:SAM-dependent methyltransferase|nr:methyltransferase domain-containing protein [Rhizomicrobium sp.]